MCSLKLGGVRVLNTDGERVDKDDAKAVDDTVTVSLRDGLGDGPYVVAWNVVSADSHPVNGAFTFVVGAGAAATDEQVASLLALPSDKAWRVAAGVGRFLSYAGLLLAAGGIVFLTVVDRRRPSKRVAKLVVGAAVDRRLGLLVQIPLQAAIATETGWHALLSPSRWIDVLSNTGFRWSTILGIVGAAFVAAGRVGRLACVGRPRRCLGHVRVVRAHRPFPKHEPRVAGDPRGHRARGRGGGLVRRRRAADPDVEAAKRRR